MDDAVTVKISADTLNKIKNIAYDLKWQNNRGTAKPYFLVIKTKKWRVANDEYATGETRTVRVDMEYDPKEFKNFEEYTKWYKVCDPDAQDERIRHEWNNLPEHILEAYDEEDNVFFTDRGYEEHMRLNGHNVRRGGEVHTYMKHAFRNPEMEAVFKLIEEIGNA